jgi:hypothetical protein
MNYTVQLTSAEDKALGYVALSQGDWINHAAKERCRVAMDEIAAIAMQKCFDSNTAVPSTKDELVELAFARGWVKSGAQRNAEHEATLGTAQPSQ